MPDRAKPIANQASIVDQVQLAYFRAVARSQNVTRAAHELGITQPALSRSLDRLGAELGVPLFERAGRGIRLSRYGEAFLPHAERALRELEDGRRRLDDLGGETRGTVALGFLHTLGITLVPRLVHAFRAEHPDVGFALAEGAGGVLLRRLVAGEFDLCFSSGPPDDPRIGWTALGEEELILIVAREHRLAARRRVRLHEVADEPFVTYSTSTAMRAHGEDLCRRAGFTPRSAFDGDETPTVAGFVAAGLGVAIVPAVPAIGNAVARLRITEPPARRTIGVLWLADRYLSDAARAFRDLAIARASR
jgi:DNA-binding transcriptional LysR family regulator